MTTSSACSTASTQVARLIEVLMAASRCGVEPCFTMSGHVSGSADDLEVEFDD